MGAVAESREDGVSDISQMQHSPCGASFRFPSSEDRRVPGANALISTGIGICFMTRLGRFVSTLRLDLPECRTVRDTRFSLGAADRTDKAGEADPVEVHACPEASEPDESAQEMLDISGQTCFLHVLCRTDLRTKIKVARA